MLERIAEISCSTIILNGNAYSEMRAHQDEIVQGDKIYSTFAEMYLEKPLDLQMGITPTVCTWRGVPTVDDW